MGVYVQCVWIVRYGYAFVYNSIATQLEREMGVGSEGVFTLE